jgi:hypothetical protein
MRICDDGLRKPAIIENKSQDAIPVRQSKPDRAVFCLSGFADGKSQESEKMKFMRKSLNSDATRAGCPAIYFAPR